MYVHFSVNTAVAHLLIYKHFFFFSELLSRVAFFLLIAQQRHVSMTCCLQILKKGSVISK